MSAAWVGSDKIFMAFMGSAEEPSINILVYTLEYELIKSIPLEDTMVMISSMVLTPDEKFLVCAHLQMRVTFINLVMFKVTHDYPFGEDDDEEETTVWRVAVTESGKLVFATSTGLYTGKLVGSGTFEG